MDQNELKVVLEAAILAAGRPLSLDNLVQLFTRKGVDIGKADVRQAISALEADYEGRGLQVAEVASGYRIQVRSSMSDWLQPLWEERAPRYTRALLETLALIAYRQPITRGEIEEVRGVTVSTNIVRTLLERQWIRVVGHRDVPGRPEMFGTTRDFLDYFSLKSLDDLPALADIQNEIANLSLQADLIETLDGSTAEQAGSAAAPAEGEADGDGGGEKPDSSASDEAVSDVTVDEEGSGPSRETSASGESA